MDAYGPPPPPPKPSVNDERMWAMFCHLSTFSGSFVPMGHILGPLILWLIKKDESVLINDQGKEAVNFQISVTIYLLVSAVLCFVLIGIPMLFAVVIFDLIVTIIAAIEANQGKFYRYPLCIRFIS